MLTIAICTNGLSTYLKICIESIIKNSNEIDEILIISMNNDQKLFSLLSLSSKIKIIFNKKKSLSRSRNIAIMNCKSKHIAFIDNDVVVSRNWFSEVKKYLNTEKYIFIGKLLIPEIYLNKKINITDNIAWIYSLHKKKEGKKYFSMFTGNAIFRVDIFYKIGLFNEFFSDFSNKPLFFAEDFEFFQRCIYNGYYPVYLSKALAYHYFSIYRLSNIYIAKRCIEDGMTNFVINLIYCSLFFRRNFLVSLVKSFIFTQKKTYNYQNIFYFFLSQIGIVYIFLNCFFSKKTKKRLISNTYNVKAPYFNLRM